MQRQRVNNVFTQCFTVQIVHLYTVHNHSTRFVETLGT